MVAGNVVLDLSPDFGETRGLNPAEVFTPGRLTTVGAVAVTPGGAVSNTGLPSARMGLKTVLLTKVGADAFGDMLSGCMSAHGAGDLRLVRDAQSGTSYSVVLNLPGQDRIFLHFTGANDTFTAGDMDYELAARCRAVHFGYPPLMRGMYRDGGRETIDMFRRLKQCGTVTSLDMAQPDPTAESGRVDWEAVLRAALPYVDIYLPSFEETAYMLDRPYYNELRASGRDAVEIMDVGKLSDYAAQLLGMGAAVVVIKCGARGYYLRTASKERLSKLTPNMPIDFAAWAGRELLCEARSVERVVSSTGAGDASIGGFLAAMLNGRDPLGCVNVALAAAAHCLGTVDAASGIPPYAKLEEFVASPRPRLHMGEPGGGWRRACDGVYVGRADREF